MSPLLPSPDQRRHRFTASLTLGGFLLLSCGGNPAGAPGQGAANLPPQTNPAIKDNDKDKKDNEGPKRTIQGEVTDVFTGEPIEKGTLIIEGISTTVTSTPIPPAPSPSDEGGGPPRIDGQGQGGIQLAQIPSGDPTGDPDLSGNEGAARRSPSPAASGTSPRPSGSSASPLGLVSPAAGALSSPSGAGSPSPTASTASGGSPRPMGTPYPATPVKLDSRGKFEVKDLPEGSYNLTFWAPGYQAQSFQGSLPSKLEVQLRPFEVPSKKLHDLKGIVRQASNQPAGNAEVEISSVSGKLPGVHETTDDNGNFAMKGLLGNTNYALAAWTTNLDGEVTTFAMVKEVPVNFGRELRNISPTLVLRAVTAPVLLAGTVDGTITEEDEKAAKTAKKAVEGIRATNVRAYIQYNDGEIPLSSAPVGKDGYFRLRLPDLPEGATYHLVASGTSDSGQTAYAHEYALKKSNPKLILTLPKPPDQVTVNDRSKGPRFAWEPVGSDVSAYRLSIEGVGQDGDTLWEGWTTGTAIGLPKVKELGLLKEGESYRYSLTAIKLEEKGKLEMATLATQPWSSSGITKPATFEVQRVKAGQSQAVTPPGKPRPPVPATHAPEGASAKPSGGASARPATPKPTLRPPTVPSTKPTPKNPRIKPLTDL